MRILGIAALLAGLALSGPALAGGGDCFGSTHQSVSTENGTLTVTATKPAAETVVESEKKVATKKDTNG